MVFRYVRTGYEYSGPRRSGTLGWPGIRMYATGNWEEGPSPPNRRFDCCIRGDVSSSKSLRKYFWGFFCLSTMGHTTSRRGGLWVAMDALLKCKEF